MKLSIYNLNGEKTKYTEISTKAIQLLGGYGFMQEYPVERIHRDSFGPLLYEGTSQIQALMSLKDLVKEVLKNPKAFMRDFLTPISLAASVAQKNELDGQFLKIEIEYKKNLMRLMLKTLKPEGTKVFNLKAWQNEEKISKLMTHADSLCQALCYIETLRVLTKHASLDSSRETLLQDYRLLVMPRLSALYLDWELRS